MDSKTSRIFEKFENQYQEFWNEERLAKERKLNLSREEIYALASIVLQRIWRKNRRAKTIAGLYLNRVRKGMKLQSDPTVIYAINKENNFTQDIKECYTKHLSFPSPYNTYAVKEFHQDEFAWLTKFCRCCSKRRK